MLVSKYPGAKIVIGLLLWLAAGVWVLAALPGVARADAPVYVRAGGHDSACNGRANLDYAPALAPNCAVQSAQQGFHLAQPGDTVVLVSTAGNSLEVPLPAANGLTIAASPALTVTKTGSASSVSALTALTYTIRITNVSGSNVTDVQVVDALPPIGVVSLSSITSAGSCGLVSGFPLITCTLGSLNAGANTQVTIVVTPTAAGTIKNSVFVYSSDPGQPEASVTTSVTGVTNLSISKADSPDPVLAGQPLTYTLTITNGGPITATSILVTDTLPSSVQFNPTSPNCSHSGGIVTCNTNFLGVNQPATFTFLVTPTLTGLITNTAQITGGGTDLDQSNNVATQTTTVNHPGFVVTKSAVPPTNSTVSAGSTITYTLVVSNPWGDTTGLVLTDAIPAGAVFVGSPTTTLGSITGTITNVVLTVPSFPNNTVLTASFKVTVTGAITTITNQATLASNQSSLQSSNVVTHVLGGGPATVYLPIILKNFAPPSVSIYWDDVEPVRDKVNDADAGAGLTPDGKTDGLFKMVINPGSTPKTVTSVRLVSSQPFEWDTIPSNANPVLGVFIGSATLLNQADGSMNQLLPFALTVTLYGADSATPSRFPPDTYVYTVTVGFSDNTSVSASAKIPPAGGGVTPPPEPMSNISDVKVDPDTNQIFVASPRYDLVYVIAGSTDTVTRTVPVGNGPTGLTVLKASVAVNNKVFAAHQYGANFWQPGVKAFGVNAASSHDTDFGGYVGAAPVKIAADAATGRVYVSNYFDKLAVLNGDSGPPETRLGWVLQKGFQGAYGIDVSQATHRVYLATRDTGELVVFNGNNDRLLAGDYVPTHVKPPDACSLWSVAVNESTGHVFVPCPARGKVYVLDEGQVTVNSLESLGVLEHREDGLALVVAAVSAPWITEISVPSGAGLGEEGIAVDTTTNRVFITNARNNTVVVLQDGPTPAYDTSVAVGSGPQGIDVNPATQKVYVGNTGSANITVLSAAPPYSVITTISP